MGSNTEDNIINNHVNNYVDTFSHNVNIKPNSNILKNCKNTSLVHLQLPSKPPPTTTSDID